MKTELKNGENQETFARVKESDAEIPLNRPTFGHALFEHVGWNFMQPNSGPKERGHRLLVVTDRHRGEVSSSSKAHAFFGEEAGELFVKMMSALKLNLDDVYLLAVLRQRGEELVGATEDVLRELAKYPEVPVVSFGATAARELCGEGIRLSQGHGCERPCREGSQHIKFTPLFHPEYLLLNPGMKKTTWEDMQKIIPKLNS